MSPNYCKVDHINITPRGHRKDKKWFNSFCQVEYNQSFTVIEWNNNIINPVNSAPKT